MKKLFVLTLAVIMSLSLFCVGGFAAEDLGDPVVLDVSCGFNETDQASMTLNYCMDLIEERSGGNITFNRMMGGSVSTPLEDPTNVASGATQFGCLLETILMQQLITWQFAGNARSLEEAHELCNYIYFENPETSAICQAEAEAAGLKILAGQVTGHNGIVTREPVSSYSELAGKTYGTEIGGDTWARMGLSVQTISVPDEYESLSRGVVDSTGASLTAIYSNKWYEVAPYVLVSNATKESFWLAVNIDTWNSLTPAQQEIIETACKETGDYAIEFTDIFEGDALAAMQEEGATITYLSEEDVDWNNGLQYLTNYDTFGGFAEAMGKTEDFETVAQATLDFFGYTIEGLRETYADLF